MPFFETEQFCYSSTAILRTPASHKKKMPPVYCVRTAEHIHDEVQGIYFERKYVRLKAMPILFSIVMEAKTNEQKHCHHTLPFTTSSYYQSISPISYFTFC